MAGEQQSGQQQWCSTAAAAGAPSPSPSPLPSLLLSLLPLPLLPPLPSLTPQNGVMPHGRPHPRALVRSCPRPPSPSPSTKTTAANINNHHRRLRHRLPPQWRTVYDDKRHCKIALASTWPSCCHCRCGAGNASSVALLLHCHCQQHHRRLRHLLSSQWRTVYDDNRHCKIALASTWPSCCHCHCRAGNASSIALLLHCHRQHCTALPSHCHHWHSAVKAIGITLLLRRHRCCGTGNAVDRSSSSPLTDQC